MPGRIVHFELVAADADRASGFWNGLFGWSIAGSVMEGFDYRMFDLGEGQGGAIYPAQEGQSAGAPIVYFDTEDIEASIAKVRELGGTADDKQPVPTHGWFAGCKDTEGNAFSLWQGDETRLERLVARARRPRRAGGVGASRGDGKVRRACRRARGARLLDRGSSSPSGSLVLVTVRGSGIGGLRHVGSTPTWMWIGGLMGFTVVAGSRSRSRGPAPRP